MVLAQDQAQASQSARIVEEQEYQSALSEWEDYKERTSNEDKDSETNPLSAIDRQILDYKKYLIEIEERPNVTSIEDKISVEKQSFDNWQESNKEKNAQYSNQLFDIAKSEQTKWDNYLKKK